MPSRRSTLPCPTDAQLLRTGAQRQGGTRGGESRNADHDAICERIRNSSFGFELYFIEKSVLEESPEERERVFNAMWGQGGFSFWRVNYQDRVFNQEAN
ncbi:MAG: hypothetical protein IVW54_20585 [Candidatus Binataceae bacterium]|nr:hypothetical protein [Candidatus Binataceae bacterium]